MIDDYHDLIDIDESYATPRLSHTGECWVCHESGQRVRDDIAEAAIAWRVATVLEPHLTFDEWLALHLGSPHDMILMALKHARANCS